MSEEYHLSKGGEKFGPYGAQEAEEQIRNGNFGPNDLGWKEGMAEWQPLKTVFPAAFSADATPPAIPQVAGSMPAGAGQPANQPAGPLKEGMATGSMVLGILALTACSLVTGLPAIIMGHMARGKALKNPSEYGGAGKALAGLVMGYVSMATGAFMALVFAGMMVPAFAKAKQKAARIKCINNLKQVALAQKIYAADHEDLYPFQISEAKGGAKEQASPDPDVNEANPFVFLMLMKNEMGSPKILTCPNHQGVQPAVDWDQLTPAHLSYTFRTSADVSEYNPGAVMIWCPHHDGNYNVALTDGSVIQANEMLFQSLIEDSKSLAR